MLTVSKALLRSSDTTMVRSGGCFLLKPWVIWLVSLWRAVVVEWRALKPCWCLTAGMLVVMCGSSIFSSVFAIGESSEIGLYEVPMQRSLFGFGMGIILASFQICGMVFRFRARFNVSVRNWMASGPRCLRWRILMLSGPVELLFALLLIASRV